MIVKEHGRTLSHDEWNDFIEALLEAHHVVITTHQNSDGDGLGSQVALAAVLTTLGKQVSLVNPTEVPSNYLFFTERFRIDVFDDRSEESIQEIALADLVVLLDANLPERMGALWKHVLAGREMGFLKVICLDHHLEPEDFADLMICETYASSTGELVYDLVRAMEKHLGKQLLDEQVAEGLYTAIMTDTGSFRFPKTSPYVYSIAGELVRAGADPNGIYDRVYNSLNPRSLKLLGSALNEIRFLDEENISWLFISQDMLKRTQSKLFDTDIIIKYLLSVPSVKIAVLMVEMLDGRTKASFRSRGEIPVNEIAGMYGGGGHRNAAGCVLAYSPEKAIQVVLKDIQAFLHRTTL
ncbi:MULTISPECIES: DHH family phosphoesterase [Prosthecochloris]|uniref:Bifunctional oligoribonuclease/PAP phosphatase NrnA n=1 Tax=Prosthecochloris vibrioformis TaxID=1098 RepID=A0A5C4S1J4_PROVB|nr:MULTISPECIES: bifunctional oligoribonuclease/PAP phosphatase NrnA [Prosthecochloris]ANT64835.1 Bifunctional oligoribonuclease and PAP phosphatase NrnA [Prosthecochloris sp. CIB 2401]TNJ37079.1 bifunctional oligoribonuclease/PAP phosphatase NrnA [Prosthecochloris vibrioformis]